MCCCNHTTRELCRCNHTIRELCRCNGITRQSEHISRDDFRVMPLQPYNSRVMPLQRHNSAKRAPSHKNRLIWMDLNFPLRPDLRTKKLFAAVAHKSVCAIAPGFLSASAATPLPHPRLAHASPMLRPCLAPASLPLPRPSRAPRTQRPSSRLGNAADRQTSKW